MSMIAKHSKTYNSGFTLIEILIALLVMSIGVLGMAGLQLTSARYAMDAHVNTLTAQAADEIITKIRMRTMKLEQTADKPARQGEVSAIASASPAGSCNPALTDFANDLACWNERLGEELPEGQGSITDNNDGTLTITISWYDTELQNLRDTSWNIRIY